MPGGPGRPGGPDGPPNELEIQSEQFHIVSRFDCDLIVSDRYSVSPCADTIATIKQQMQRRITLALISVAIYH